MTSIVDMFKYSREFYNQTVLNSTRDECENRINNIYFLSQSQLKKYNFSEPEHLHYTFENDEKEDIKYHYIVIDESYDYIILMNMKTGDTHAVHIDIDYDADYKISLVDQTTSKFLNKPAREGIWQRTIDVKILEKVKSLFPDDLTSVQKHLGTNKGITIHDIVHPSHYFRRSFNEKPHRFSRDPIDTPYCWMPHRFIKRNKMYICDNDTPVVTSDTRKSIEFVFNMLIQDLEHACKYSQIVEFPSDDTCDDNYMEMDEFLSAKDIERSSGNIKSLPDTLQVYIKIVDIELSPHSVHSGVWHLEGLPQEHIVCTGICYLPCELFSGIIFKRHHTICERATMIMGSGQSNPLANDLTTSYLPLGTINIEADTTTTLVFPNTHIHRVMPCVNNTKSIVHRKAIIFFLVDPDICLPDWTTDVAIPSTEDIIKENMNVRMKEKKSLEPLEINFCEH